MTSAIVSSTPNLHNAQEQASAPPTAIDSTSPLSGAVPAQQPGRSYASAITATQTPPTPAGASAPAQNVKAVSESPVNGAPQMTQGGSQAANSVPNGTPSSEHTRKPSVVISASGAAGSLPSGGPVQGGGGRPPITFGNMSSQGSPLMPSGMPQQPQTGLTASATNSRVISPTHSPSPIPQPPVSGGPRPPSSLQQNQSNGMTFGSMGGDGEQMRQGQMQPGPLAPGMHERRTSSQSMQGDMSMRGNFMMPNGRGRGFAPQPPYGAPSPAPNYRQASNPSRGVPPNVPPQFQQQMQPGSPYNRGRNSPAMNPNQPNMAPQHMGGNSSMQYGGYPSQMGPQHQQQGMYPHFDPQAGYYQPYWYGSQPPPSPRPPYPSPYGAPQHPGQPPFYPPNMSRSTSQAGSERPPSSMGGHSQTPSMAPAQQQTQGQSNQQASGQQSSGSQFIKPTSKAIKITDAQGNAINLGKPSPSPSTAAAAQPQTPLIVSTPNAPTPPPRAPSNQHVRTESKTAPTQTAEERKNLFQEQVKRQMEEEKRKNEEAEAAKAKPEESAVVSKVDEHTEGAEVVQDDVVKEATVEAEKAAAVDAADEAGVEAAEAAESAVAKSDDEPKAPQEETEEERLEREIAEMEAREAEEEERERAYQEKKRKAKEESATKEAEAAAKADEELKRQEREAEEREEEREREREAEKQAAQEPDDASRDMFAQLKKPDIGPGASTPASGTETPMSEEPEEASMPETSMPPPAQPSSASQSRAAGTQKPKPANLKLDTTKRVEPSEPTPGMQALKSARFLALKEEAMYPDGFKSPNPAVNLVGSRKARAYDKDFLLQFQNIFKEKPSVDWDQKVRETLGPGDEPGSARPQSARTPSSNMGRSASNRPGPQAMPSFGGPMGNFGGQAARNLPPGTTSEQRFAASQGNQRPGMGAMPQMGARVPSQLGMNSQSVGMSRTSSLQSMGNMQAPGSPRMGGSTRGGNRGSRRGGDRAMSKKEEEEAARKMPLTAHMEVKGLEKSGTGWKASSIGQPMAAQPDPSGNMPPDMVQRKVKAALNKMTPEKFDKISDQILEIAAQSKNESDGRTLRQVIQLTFEKACDEAHWAGMYARFCSKMLTTMSTDIRDETIKDKAGNPVVGGALFRKYLLNRCQEEFERGWQVNLPEQPEGETHEAALLSDEYYVAAAAKRRGLGLIQFIGQLYKLRMLTLRIMHECVQKLLNFEGDPDEAAIENLTTLLKAVGATMDEDEQGPGLLKMYFDRIDTAILKSDKLPSRPRFMILDLIDLKNAGWKGKDDTKGPKTIAQIREEADAAAAKAAAEAQRTAQRGGPGGGRPPAGRGDARNFSGGGQQPPVDLQRNYIGMDDLRRLQNRGNTPRQAGSMGPGGNLGPGGSMLAPRAGSRRGAGNLAPSSSGNTTRTNTPPVDNKDKKEEQSSQNTFGALASLDPSGEAHEEASTRSEAASPPAARNRSTSPLAAEKQTEESSTA